MGSIPYLFGRVALSEQGGVSPGAAGLKPRRVSNGAE